MNNKVLVATAITLRGFEDLGHSVTLIFFLEYHVFYRLRFSEKLKKKCTLIFPLRAIELRSFKRFV